MLLLGAAIGVPTTALRCVEHSTGGGSSSVVRTGLFGHGRIRDRGHAHHRPIRRRRRTTTRIRKYVVLRSGFRMEWLLRRCLLSDRPLLLLRLNLGGGAGGVVSCCGKNLDCTSGEKGSVPKKSSLTLVCVVLSVASSTGTGSAAAAPNKGWFFCVKSAKGSPPPPPLVVPPPKALPKSAKPATRSY